MSHYCKHTIKQKVYLEDYWLFASMHCMFFVRDCWVRSQQLQGLLTMRPKKVDDWEQGTVDLSYATHPCNVSFYISQREFRSYNMIGFFPKISCASNAAFKNYPRKITCKQKKITLMNSLGSVGASKTISSGSQVAVREPPTAIIIF